MSARRSELRAFLRALTHQNRRELVWVTLVQLVSTATQGLGLLLLVPLLGAAGLGPGGRAATSGGLGGLARSLVGIVGVSATLRSLLVTYVVLVTVSATLSAYASVRLVRYRLDFVDGLRERLYEAVAAAEWKHLASLRRSDVLSAITLNVAVVANGAFAFLQLSVASILIVVQFAVALRISPWITALAAGTGGSLIALSWPLVARSRRLGRKLVEDNRGVVGSITGFLDGLKLAKAHGLESAHVATFNDAIRSSRRSQVAFAAAQTATTAAQTAATAVMLAVVVVIAVERLHLALASLLVVAFIFSRLVPQITSAQQQVNQIAQSLPAFGDLLEVIESCEGSSEPAVDNGARLRLARSVRLESVSFSYGGGGDAAAVLHDVTFEVAAHRTTAVVGSSGAGKTTLADIVVGLLRPVTGQVVVDGHPLTDADLRAWRAGIGLVPQDPFLFHDTLRANLLWACPHASDDELWEALRTAAAEDFVTRLANGLETVVGDRGTRLSGGERQRIALARALLRQPELLVLDEATSSLDNANELAIRDALARLHGDTTMVIIAHRLSTVSHADAIIVLDAGRIAESGSWAELASRPTGSLRALLDAGSIN